MNRILLAVFLGLFAMVPGQAQDIGIQIEVVETKQIEFEWTKACSSPVKDPTDVSLVQLIATPERFEGRPISVIGYYRNGFEHSAIYLNKSDYENDIWNNGLWVEASREMPTDSGYVIIEGIYTSELTGHLGAWPGGICNVSFVEKWPGHEH